MTNLIYMPVPWWIQFVAVAISFGALGFAGYRLAARDWVITLADHYEMQVIAGSIVAMATGTALARVAGFGIGVALPLGAGGGWALVQTLQRPAVSQVVDPGWDEVDRREAAWGAIGGVPLVLPLLNIHWSAQLMISPASLLAVAGIVHVAGIAAGTAPGADG